MGRHMRKLIFLDIDGVLNHQQGHEDGECAYDFNEKYQKFSTTSTALLNKLIEKTNAEIVISSTWRCDGLERMREIWTLEGMSGDITGITPHFSINGYGSAPRGCEIESYLKNQGFWHINYSKDEQQKYMDKSSIINYIILDDDSDMLYGQRNHFINTPPPPRNYSGFNQQYYEQALKILSSDIISLNYD